MCRSVRRHRRDSGATVTLIDEDTDKKQVWQIVGEPEADAKSGPHLDLLAARARATRQEERRECRSGHPGGAKAYEVIKVEWR